ncbi:MAG: acyl-CoA dehydrogenase family protein, partial [Thermodesulfobacteriota bacterium]
MTNFYTDNSDILFHMQKMELSRIISLKEDDFSEKEEYAHAPQDLEDARDNYQRVLEIVGDIAGNYVAPRAEEVDRQGAKLENGEVYYAQGTKEDLDRLAKADLMGFTLPRYYGGINMPKTVYSVAIEMISRADASLMNLFGLQEIADTIQKFGSEQQKADFLPRFSSGEVTGAMALTEPDAGSDLQSVMLKAEQGDDGTWYLNGVKRFITNGCGNVLLVLARSEAGSTGGRGLSLFLYERDQNMQI